MNQRFHLGSERIRVSVPQSTKIDVVQLGSVFIVEIIRHLPVGMFSSGRQFGPFSSISQTRQPTETRIMWETHIPLRVGILSLAPNVPHHTSSPNNTYLCFKGEYRTSSCLVVLSAAAILATLFFFLNIFHVILIFQQTHLVSISA